jgi:hypothetical protein
MNNKTWLTVIFANECDDEGNCPVCFTDYTDCPCPGPTMDDDWEYRVVDDEGRRCFEARRRKLPCESTVT